MNIVFRNKKSYLQRNIVLGELNTTANMKNAVDFWNNTFNIDYFSFRKKLRRVSYDILKSQKCVEKIYVYYTHSELKNPNYLNKIYAPMDDDDIFLMSGEEYEECMSNMNKKCNSVILGYYQQKYLKLNELVYIKNPKRFKVHTNNMIYRHDSIPQHETHSVFQHYVAGISPLLKSREMRHIETSLHLVHPCSVTMMRGFPNFGETWYKVKYGKNRTGESSFSTETKVQPVDRMLILINEFINETRYKEALPNKFWTHMETFKNIYSELKLK